MARRGKDDDIPKTKKDDLEERNRKMKGPQGKRRIEIKYIENKTKRQTCFSKRRNGVMKKAFELHKSTGAQVLILVASETAHIYTFATQKFEPFLKDLKNVGSGLRQFVPQENVVEKK